MMIVVLIVVIVFMYVSVVFFFFFFKQKTAYEMRISDWSSDVCSSDLQREAVETPFLDPVEAARRRFEGIERRDEIVRIAGKLIVAGFEKQIGRASCRERVCQYV